MSNTSHIFSSVLSTLAGVVVGSLLTQFFSKSRDSNHDEKKLHREMFGLLNTISFSLTTQYSELYNLQKNLENRLAILDDKIRMQDRNDRILAVQDFTLDDSVIINFGNS